MASEVTIPSFQKSMASEVTIPGNTILELVEHWGSTPDNDTAAFITIDPVREERRELTRKEVLDLSKRFAHKLSKYGIKKGDIVCNALPNCLERIVCEFGIHFSGAASMNGQVLRSDGEDFIAAVKTSRCTSVILDPTVPRGARLILLKYVPRGCEDCIESKDLPDLKRLIICTRDNVNKENDFIECLRNVELPQFRADVVPSDLATVMTTSGSTGYSKLVMHSHANICHFGKQVKAIEPMPSGTHFINNAQLGWAGGYPQWYLSCGVTRYFIDVHDGLVFDIPHTLWKIMIEEEIHYGFLSPMHAEMLVQGFWELARWRPKVICLAGQPIKIRHMSMLGRLCYAVDVNYGMTECNVVTTHRVRHISDFKKDGCAGFPGYGVKLKVVDANREEVPQGTRGEILVWSPSLCTGYLNDDDSTKASFTSDGWLCTDDAGYIGTDGKVYIEGRQSDTISRGVYILYPGWLENKLREFPEVRDVAVVAVPDAVLHHEVCACVVVAGVKGVIAGGQHPAYSDDFQEADDKPTSKDIPSDDTHSDDKSQEAADKAAPKDIPADDPHSDDKKFQEATSKDIPSDDTHSDDKSQEAADKAAPKDIPADDTHSDDKKFQEATSKDIPAEDTQSDGKFQEATSKDIPATSKDIPATSKDIPADAHSDDKFQKAADKATPKDIPADEGFSHQAIIHNPHLIVLEKKLRKFADDLNLLHEKDAMRMVPKFYVFMERFPVTSTGKQSRKQLRKIAAEALGLEEAV